MELSPRSVANTSFKTVKKGYDPADVRAYLESLAKAIEGLQSHATTMESRARAALARLQEIAAQPVQPAPAEEPAPVPTPFATVAIAESETISRTLLLAQRTADSTVAAAIAEATQIIDDANDKGSNLVKGAEESAQRMIEEAVAEARRAGEGQRNEIENEVQSLLARREFLMSDVDHLDLHIVTQRERLSDVAAALTEIASAVPGGLGDVRRPLISAVGGDTAASSTPSERAMSADSTGATAGDDLAGPVYDALEASSAMSALEDDDRDNEQDNEQDNEHDVGKIEPLSVPEPVTLTPIAEPELDPRRSGQVDHGHAEAAADAADVATDDAGTPPYGEPTPFQFDDPTGEVPLLSPQPGETETSAGDGRH